MGVQQFEELEHHARAAQGRRVSPSRKSGLRSGHGLGHFCGVGQGDLAGHGARGGVGHALAAAGCACGDLAANVMTDVGNAHGKSLWLVPVA